MIGRLLVVLHGLRGELTGDAHLARAHAYATRRDLR